MFSRTEKRIIKHFSNPNPSTRIRDIAECCGISEMYAYQTIRRLEAGESVEKIQYVEETYFDCEMDLSELLESRPY